MIELDSKKIVVDRDYFAKSGGVEIYSKPKKGDLVGPTEIALIERTLGFLPSFVQHVIKKMDCFSFAFKTIYHVKNRGSIAQIAVIIANEPVTIEWGPRTDYKFSICSRTVASVWIHPQDHYYYFKIGDRYYSDKPSNQSAKHFGCTVKADGSGLIFDEGLDLSGFNHLESELERLEKA